MPPARLKIHPFARKRALALLARGHTRAEIALLMQARHPGYTLKQVMAAYFPTKGQFAIPAKLEGASRDEILAKLRMIDSTRRRQSEVMSELRSQPDFLAGLESGRQRVWQNEEYLERHARASRKTMVRLNSDPAFREAASRRMTKLRESPEFMAKLLEGIRRSNSQSAAARESARLELESRGISAGKGYAQKTAKEQRLPPIDIRTPERLAVRRLETEVLAAAINELSPFERFVISAHFVDGISIETLAQQAGRNVKSIAGSIDESLSKLRKNPRLIETFG